MDKPKLYQEVLNYPDISRVLPVHTIFREHFSRFWKSLQSRMFVKASDFLEYVPRMEKLLAMVSR